MLIDNHEVDKALKTLTIIWVAMVVSPIIYLFVIPRHLGEDYAAVLPPDAYRMLRIALYVVSLGTILGARFILKLILLADAKLSRRATSNSHPAIQRYASSMVTALALCESVAIYGLVLYIMGKDTSSLYLLCFVSILSMLMYRPTRQGIVDTATQLDTFPRGAGTPS